MGTNNDAGFLRLDCATTPAPLAQIVPRMVRAVRGSTAA